MPAESKSQQRLFALALSYKRGEVKDVSDRVKELAGSMSESELEDFAATPHKGLPEKKAGYDLVFYANRSTPQVLKSGEDPKPKKGYGKQTKRRPATEEEVKKINRGDWLRVDEKGNKPTSKGYKKTQYRPGLLKKKSGNGFIRPENWGKDYEKFNWEMYSGANDWELKNTWAWVNFKEDDGSVGAVKRVWFELEQPDGDTEKEWEAYDGNNTFHKALYKEAEKRAKEYAGEGTNDSKTSKFDWERAFSDLAEDPSSLPGVKNSGIERSEFKEIKTAHLSLAKAAGKIPFKVLRAIREGDKSSLREFGRRGGLSKAKPDFSETEQLLNRLKMLYHTDHKKLPSVKHVDSWLTKSSAAPQGSPVDPALLGLGVLGGGTFSGAALGSLLSEKGNKGRGTALGGATGMGAALGAAAPALFPGSSGGPPSSRTTLASSALGALLANRIAAGLVGDKDAERAAVIQKELQNAMGQAK
jgi:hypothetical protein